MLNFIWYYSGEGGSYTLCLLFCNPDSYIPGSLQALQCSSNPQTPVSPSFSCTKVRAHWATRKEENLSRFQCMTTCHLAVKVCFHANIQSASFQAEWKPHTRGLRRFDPFLQWLISRCMYAWLFVNMCSFLIFFLKYAVIISGICKSEGSRCVLLDFTKFYYWVIIKYCVIALQVSLCSFNFYRKF